MGVPALFRWLSSKYPKIVSAVIEERPFEIDGHVYEVDATKPNPNGAEFDNLYLDFNGIVHPCTHPEDKPPPATEGEMMLEIFKYTDRVVKMARPRKLLFIAVDGVAPRAKMNQQRSRRFRSAQEAKEADEKKEEFSKLLKAQQQKKKKKDGVEETQETLEEAVIKKTWDSNSITPGTPFMHILALSLRYWVAYKLNTDPAWEKLKIIISDAQVPGEGEHKIMEFIRSQRSSPEHNPNTSHVFYGLDADLIMLGLATHEPHFRILREDVFAQESKAQTCKLCGQKGHRAESCRGSAKEKKGAFDEKQSGEVVKPFIWLNVSILREYLEAELYVPNQPFRFDLERALDDWVFMCFFVGNDFLPHLPSLDIRENGIDTLIALWRDSIPVMGGYLTKDGHVDLQRAQIILHGLAKQEDAIFRKRKEVEDKREANQKRRKAEEERRNQARQNGTKRRRSSPDYGNNSVRTMGKGDNRVALDADLPTKALSSLPAGDHVPKPNLEISYNSVVNRGAIDRTNVANKSAAAVLKSQLLGSKPKEPEPSNGTFSGANGDDTAATSDPVTQTPPSALGKRKADLLADDDNGTPGRTTPNTPNTPQNEENIEDGPPIDTVRLWEEGYADRYYEQKFKVPASDIEFRHKVARAYAEGLAWVLLYYFQGCASWTWYYPYHYAPFAADFVDLDQMKISFDKGKPFRPYEQLMGVMPAASNHTIPEPFHILMTAEDSEIIDFYPEEFEVDLNGKKWAWQGVALLPFIDEKRLLDAMGKRYPMLTADEHSRNETGKEVLLVSERHPLYEELAANFYSKKQGTPKHKLNIRVSGGLAGKVEKNDTYLPHSSLTAPLDDAPLPSLDEDRSMSVYYEMPKSSHVHKSMLLRGVKLAPSELDQTDIQQVKNKARTSGRTFGGGVPFDDRRSNGRGRGGRDSYGNDRPRDDRPNPFAAHLNPNFQPPPPPQMGGYPVGPPPPRGLGRGPPPPPAPPPGDFSYGYGGGHQGYRGSNGGGYGGPPQDGYKNGGGRDYYDGRDSYRSDSRHGDYDSRGQGGRDSYRGGYDPRYGRY